MDGTHSAGEEDRKPITRPEGYIQVGLFEGEAHLKVSPEAQPVLLWLS